MTDQDIKDVYRYAGLAEACREEDFDDKALYIDGWYWGVVCGVCATLAAIAICFALGYVLAPLF